MISPRARAVWEWLCWESERVKALEALEEFNRMITDHPSDASVLESTYNSRDRKWNTPGLGTTGRKSAAVLSPKDAEIYAVWVKHIWFQKKKGSFYVAFEKQ